MKKKPWIQPKRKWSEIFKYGYAAGARRVSNDARRKIQQIHLIDLETCKSIDRAACRAIENRHCGNDNAIKRGYRSFY